MAANNREKLVAQLLASDQAGRGHHAYLLSGPQGGGMNSVVEQLATKWMASSVDLEPNTLNKIRKRIHPDLMWIVPEGRTLKVDEIRDIPRQLSYSPLEAAKRVVVIANAEKMSVSAANALLKSLEEPPESSRFVLLVDDPNLVLETIRSRCQLVRVPPMSRAEILGELRNQYNGVEEMKLSEAAALSGGSQSKAEAYLDSEENQKLVSSAVRALLRSWEWSYMVPVEAFSFLDLTKRYDQGVLVVRAWIAQLSDLLRIRESKRKGIQCNTSELTFAQNLAAMEKMIDSEGVDSIRIDTILNRSEKLSQALRALNGNANVRLILTNLMVDLQAGHVR